MAGGEDEAERDNYYPCSNPAGNGDSGGWGRGDRKKLGEYEESDELGSTADAGDLYDAAERDEAQIDNDIEPGKAACLWERPENKQAGAQNTAPFEGCVENDEADIARPAAGGESGGEVFEGSTNLGLQGFGEEGERFAETGGKGIAAESGHDQDDEAGDAHYRDEDAPGLEHPFKGGADVAAGGVERGEADAEQEQDGEQIVDSFEEPGRHLGGEGDVFRTGDEVRPDEFAGATEEDDGSEADHRIFENAPERGMRIQGT